MNSFAALSPDRKLGRLCIEGERLTCADPLAGFIADHFHLGGIVEIATGIVCIGGAGTFDGIVRSGIVAAYLA
jgi:hypothetical protein